MATTYKVLGQSAPLATTATTLYTVPSSTATIVSSITICNRGTVAASYRIAIRQHGDSLAKLQYVAFDSPINPKDTIALTLGITADAADVITVYASTADFTFNAFGSEIS